MNKYKAMLIFSMAVALFLFGAQGVFGQDTSAKSPESPTSAVNPDAYEIGIGDILGIVTWKEPDFTLDVVVRTDGKITFPLLNDLVAAGRTPGQVKTEIEKGLDQFIADPVVTVIVKVPTSQKFYVLGEVQQTGEYPLIKELTVLQAFALAGGFTEWASKNEIILMRREGGQQKVIRINYKDIVKGKNLEQDMLLKAGDTIIVP